MLHQGLTKEEAYKKTLELLVSVGISTPEKVAESYAFQLSGGMSQRVMIAISLACKPKLLIADEPTTALDVTIQAQILHLMNELKKELKTSIIFITHDLGVIKEMADQIAVMYSGKVMETASVDTIFNKNSKFLHPYTEGLMNAIPTLHTERGSKLQVIPGSVPHPLNLPPGCHFAPRCAYCQDKCNQQLPELLEVEPNHYIRCYFPKKGERK
jgi:peptide/nickel transport system ATP-binding protein